MAQGSVKKAESGGTQPNLDRHRFRPSTGRGSGDRWMAYSVARPLTRRVSPLRPQRRPRSFRGRVVAGSVLRAGRNEADRHLHRLRVLHPIPILPGMSCASASPRPAGAPAPPAARSSRRAESSPQGPITASSVNQAGPAFPGVCAENRPTGRCTFASKSAEVARSPGSRGPLGPRVSGPPPIRSPNGYGCTARSRRGGRGHSASVHSCTKVSHSGQQNRGFFSPGVTGAHAPVLQRSERRGRCHAGCHSGGQRSGVQSPVENDQTTSRSERRGLGGRAKRTGT